LKIPLSRFGWKRLPASRRSASNEPNGPMVDKRQLMGSV
jgi:hypothetical protein